MVQAGVGHGSGRYVWSGSRRDGVARGGDAVAITPSDTFQISTTRGLFVAVGGNIAVTTAAGNTLLMVGVPSGETIPIRVNQVLATGTTATGIIGLY